MKYSYFWFRYFFLVFAILLISVFCLGCAKVWQNDKNVSSEASKSEDVEIISDLNDMTNATTIENFSDVLASSEEIQTSSIETIPADINAVYDADSSKKASDYKDCIEKCFAGFAGNVSYALHIYDSDYRASNKSQPMKSASVIKIFIMEYAFNLVSKGEISTDTIIQGKSLYSLIESMITYSDNDATNILIDYFTMGKLNAFFKSRGYSDTVIARRMLDTAAAARGEENLTSSKDVMSFLDNMYANKSKYPYSEMLSIMKRQQIAAKIRRDMPSGVEIANKTGELSDTDNDVGIIFTAKGDYALVCLTGGGAPAVARDAIAKSCRAVYDEIMKQEN